MKYLKSRYAICIRSRDYLKYIMGVDELDRGRNEEFMLTMGESEFLFKSDVSSYLHLIYSKGMVLEYCIQKLYSNNDQMGIVIEGHMKELGFWNYVEGNKMRN